MTRRRTKYDPEVSPPRKRRKKPAPEPGVTPEPGTDAEELALALVLWKSLRCHGALTDGSGTHKGGAGLPTHESAAFGERAIRLADRVGVKAEFLALLFRLRLVKVTLVPMEE